MADRKITALTELTAPVATDVFPIIDVSEAANANKNKKIQLTTILRGIPNGSASAPSVGFIGDTGTSGFFRVADDEIGISCNQVQIASFSTTGFQIGDGAAAAQLHLFSTDTTDQVIIENTDTGLDTAPDLVLFRNSSSPAANDNLGNLVYRGQDDNGDAVDYATIAAQIVDVTNGSEDGILDIMTAAAGVTASRIRLKSEFVGIHEADPTFDLHLSTDNADAAFCIESNVNSSGSSADILLFHRRGDAGAGQDNDILSTITFQGKNDGANETDTVPAEIEYAAIESVIIDASDDTEDGQLNFQVMDAGSLTTKLAIDATGINILDNTKLIVGTSSDLTLVHDGTDSKITNITGNLFIEAKTSETAIKIIPDGAVELYHNNVKKAETSSTGLDVSGKLDVLHPNTNTFSEIKCNGGVSGLRISGSAAASAAFLTFANNHINTITDRWTFGTSASGASLDMVVYLGTGNTGTERLRVKGDSARIDLSCSLLPETDNTRVLGSSSKRFTTLHSAALNTGDINMSNLNDSANEVDGSKGSWTLQEGADDLFIINRVSGKKYKFNLTEIT